MTPEQLGPLSLESEPEVVEVLEKRRRIFEERMQGANDPRRMADAGSFELAVSIPPYDTPMPAVTNLPGPGARQ